MESVMPAHFLPSWLYTSPDIAERERRLYAECFWHPLTASSAISEGQVQAFVLLEVPLLLTRHQGRLHAWINRCPHRGVALEQPADQPRSCRRLVCPYHGWTYDLGGQLLAAAREGDFIVSFDRNQWPLASLLCREVGGLIWVALGHEPVALEDQLDLVLQHSPQQFNQPRSLLLRESHRLQCNWKIAHDNTLDDYHVAIAHPTTLHREQGPVRLYRHALSDYGTLLVTPYGESGEFYTYGLAPWTHLLLWPDGRLVLIQFLPEDHNHCSMDVWLLADQEQQSQAPVWMEEIQTFLREDRRLVEAAQVGYRTPFVPGPPHRLEQRIVQQQQLYLRLMGLESERLELSASVPHGEATAPWRH